MFFIPCAVFFVVMHYKVILIVLLHMLHLQNVCGFFLVSTIFIPIRIFANVTLKYWHLHSNILVIFNLLPFIVVVIDLVTLEQLHRATLFVFVQQFLIFVCIVAHSCMLHMAVYEFAGVSLAAFASEVTCGTLSVGL